MPTNKIKGASAALVVIRATRLLAGICLVVGLVLLLPLFPFLFDSPSSSPLLLIFALLSVPLTFWLSAQSYKEALAQGNLTKCLFIGTAPLLLLVLYAAIIVGSEKLRPTDLTHADATIVGAETGELFIKTPEECKPSIYRIRYSARGAWHFSNGKAVFVCDKFQHGIEEISFSEALARPLVEVEVRGSDIRLVEKDGEFDIYRLAKENRDIFELTSFTAYDGQRVFVRSKIPSGGLSYHRVSRRLDDRFELTYGVDQQTGNRTDMVETDQRIATYVKSIVRRIK